MCKEHQRYGQPFESEAVLRAAVKGDQEGQVEPESVKISLYPVPRITKPDNITKLEDNW